jgi:hypothetical protein
MKARFGRKEPREINPLTEYLVDTGNSIHLVTIDNGKKKMKNAVPDGRFKLSKKSYALLVQRNLVYLKRENGSIKYFCFRPSIIDMDMVI